LNFVKQFFVLCNQQVVGVLQTYTAVIFQDIHITLQTSRTIKPTQVVAGSARVITHENKRDAATTCVSNPCLSARDINTKLIQNSYILARAALQR
jgi:hypothetical protein